KDADLARGGLGVKAHIVVLQPRLGEERGHGLGPFAHAVGAGPEVLGPVRQHHVQAGVPAQANLGDRPDGVAEEGGVGHRTPTWFVARVGTANALIEPAQEAAYHAIMTAGPARVTSGHALAAPTAAPWEKPRVVQPEHAATAPTGRTPRRDHF